MPQNWQYGYPSYSSVIRLSDTSQYVSLKNTNVRKVSPFSEKTIPKIEGEFGFPRNHIIIFRSIDLSENENPRPFVRDEKFKPFAEKFRDDQDAFFASYTKAHKKLSELGSKFEPEGGITL